MKNNPYLLKKLGVANSHADLTVDASKTNEEDEIMKIPMEEEHGTVKYQNTLKVDVENIAQKNQMKTNI